MWYTSAYNFPHGTTLKNSMVFTIINKKGFYKLGIIWGILHQEYLKMRVKNVNILKNMNSSRNFNSIETNFLDLQKKNISCMP